MYLFSSSLTVRLDTLFAEENCNLGNSKLVNIQHCIEFVNIISHIRSSVLFCFVFCPLNLCVT